MEKGRGTACGGGIDPSVSLTADSSLSQREPDHTHTEKRDYDERIQLHPEFHKGPADRRGHGPGEQQQLSHAGASALRPGRSGRRYDPGHFPEARRGLQRHPLGAEHRHRRAPQGERTAPGLRLQRGKPRHQRRPEGREIHGRRVYLSGAPDDRHFRGGDPRREAHPRRPQHHEGGLHHGAQQDQIRPRHLRQSGEHLRRAQQIRYRPRQARKGKRAGPGDRARHGDPKRHPHPLPQDEEQSRSDRRAGRRQDRDCGGACPAYRQGGRAGGTQGQDHFLPGHGRADRGRKVPGRI